MHSFGIIAFLLFGAMIVKPSFLYSQLEEMEDSSDPRHEPILTSRVRLEMLLASLHESTKKNIIEERFSPQAKAFHKCSMISILVLTPSEQA
jgi:hypothetical protein